MVIHLRDQIFPATLKKEKKKKGAKMIFKMHGVGIGVCSVHFGSNPFFLLISTSTKKLQQIKT